MISEPKKSGLNLRPQYKINKPFYEYVDKYNDSRLKINELIKIANTGNSNTDLEQNTIKEEMKQIEIEFAEYMSNYLEEYKNDPQIYQELRFPIKLSKELANVLIVIAEKKKMFSEYKKKILFIFRENPKECIEVQTINHEIKINENKIIENEKNEEQKNVIQEKEENLDEFKFKPDPIIKILISEIKADSIKIIIDKPDENNSPILGYKLYNPITNEIIFQSKMSFFYLDLKYFDSFKFQNKLFLNFALSSENSIGESDKSFFKIILNKFKSSKISLIGSNSFNKILSNSDKSTKFQNISMFNNYVNKLCISNSVLLLMDNGLFAQWGYSCESSTLYEIPLTEYGTHLEIIESDPFYPLKTTLMHTIACGSNFCIAISLLGELFSWGSNNFGQLGHEGTNARINPTKVMGLKNNFCVEVACGLLHCVVIDDMGKTYTWGHNQAEDGIPILDRFGRVVDFQNFEFSQTFPRLISNLILEKIYCGSYFNAGINKNGEVYTWGDCEHGQLGLGVINESVLIRNITNPRKINYFVERNIKIKKIACGAFHCIALSDDYRVFVWGLSLNGECGKITNNCLLEPVEKEYFLEKKIIDIGAGNDFSLFLSENGKLFGFGNKNCPVLEKSLGDEILQIENIFEENTQGNILEIVAGYDAAGILFKN